MIIIMMLVASLNKTGNLRYQDISTYTLPSLIESPTDKSTKSTDTTDTNNNDLPNNNNAICATPTRSKQISPANAPLPIWDGTQCQLDYNHNHNQRLLWTWNGTTHTDVVYDDDDVMMMMMTIPTSLCHH